MNSLRLSTTGYTADYLRKNPPSPNTKTPFQKNNTPPSPALPFQPWAITVRYDLTGKTTDEQVQVIMSKPDFYIKKLIALADNTVAQKFVKACLLLGITDTSKMYKFANTIKSQITAGLKIALADTLPAVQACLDFGFTPAESKDFLEKLAPYSVGYVEFAPNFQTSSAYKYLDVALIQCKKINFSIDDTKKLLYELAKYSDTGSCLFMDERKINIGVAGDTFVHIEQLIGVCRDLGIVDITEMLKYLQLFSSRQKFLVHSSLSGLVKAYTVLSKYNIVDIKKTLPWLVSIADVWSGDLFAHLDQTLSIYEKFANASLVGQDLTALPPELTDILFGINPTRFTPAFPQEQITNQYEQVLVNRLQLLAKPDYTDERPLAILAYAEMDDRGALSDDALSLNLLYNKYRVLYFEESTDTALLNDFLTATATMKASLVMIAGHGDSNGLCLRLGNLGLKNEIYNLTTRDIDVWTGIISCITPKGILGFNSCYSAFGKQQNPNMVNTVADISKGAITVSGPVPDVGQPKINYTESGLVSSIDWSFSSKLIEGYVRQAK